MGSYIRIGICIEVRLYKVDIAAAGFPLDEVIRQVGKHYDLSIFDCHETDREIRWTLPTKHLEEGLVPFLRAQLTLSGKMSVEDADAMLEPIARAGSREALIELASDCSMSYFLFNELRGYPSFPLPPGRRQVQTDVLVYLIDGKASMEMSYRLFNYIEALIHSQKDEMPIAAAVKAFLA